MLADCSGVASWPSRFSVEALPQREALERGAANLRLHVRIDDARRDAANAQAAIVVERDRARVVIERGLRRAVDAPAGIRVARRAARNMGDAPVRRLRARGGEGSGKHQRSRDVHADCARDRTRILIRERPDRREHPRIVDEQHAIGARQKAAERAVREPRAERGQIGEIQLGFVQPAGIARRKAALRLREIARISASRESSASASAAPRPRVWPVTIARVVCGMERSGGLEGVDVFRF